MNNFNKQLKAVFMIGMLLISMALLLPLAASASEAEIAEGIYEGEYDANGKRSGYGVWTYYNFRYEGDWENDTPNGEGVLYESRALDWAQDYISIIQGHWVDGLGEGTMLETSYWHAEGSATNPLSDVFSYTVNRGASEPVVLAGFFTDGNTTEQTEMSITGYGVLAGVPPWAEPSRIDPSLSPPAPGAFALTSWDIVERINQLEVPEDSSLYSVYSSAPLTDYDWQFGLEQYQGEYDENGKRSGYGTWTYYNYLYEGYFENDMPNGEGVLHHQFTVPDGSGGTLFAKTVVKGVFVDGLAEGEAEYTSIGPYDHVYTDYYSVTEGLTEEGGLVGLVPPWGDDGGVEKATPAPAPDLMTRPTWKDIVERELVNQGVYEGEYDANGNRSGQGAWQYHNYLYVGGWKNGMPYGEGTLYVQTSNEADWVSGYITHGNWFDGVAVGEFELTHIQEVSFLPETSVHVYQMATAASREYSYQAANARIRKDYGQLYFACSVAPWGTVDMVDSEANSPWALYEAYPAGKFEYTPLEKLESTGMSVSAGNLANGRNMAAVGGWIYFVDRKLKSNVSSIYRMRADGTQMEKVHENVVEAYAFSSNFHTLGDWLYLGSSGNSDMQWMYRTQPGDGEIVKEQGEIRNLVVDGWEYQTSYGMVEKFALNSSEGVYLGSYDYDMAKSLFADEILFADENWVYVYHSELVPDSKTRTLTCDIIKVRNDGSGEVEIHPVNDAVGVSPPQIVDGRLYYTEMHITKNGYGEESLHSVDLDFSQAPITIVPINEHHSIRTYHVTEDAIYYCAAANAARKVKKASLVRVDHDGSNPTVLIDGFENDKYVSGTSNILIAGDWMQFIAEGTYLMRLDGSDLHKLGEPFVTENAPGITDSTGKWRYELLPDGSAMILGAGSKLKPTGMLSIPAKVDGIPVTAIGAWAFSVCEDFTGVSIPKGVTSIGDYAFQGCNGLTSLSLPEGVTNIGEKAFQWCSQVKKLSLPASLTSVGAQAFADCPSAKLSVAKKSETFEIRDGVLFDKVQNRVVD